MFTLGPERRRLWKWQIEYEWAWRGNQGGEGEVPAMGRGGRGGQGSQTSGAMFRGVSIKQNLGARGLLATIYQLALKNGVLNCT
jgi:hypothetical protein